MTLRRTYPNIRDIKSLRAVIFDMDGTLYDHDKIRKIMVRQIVSFLLTHPWRIKEIQVIQTFRKCRDQFSEAVFEDLDSVQYQVVADKFGVTQEYVRTVVQRWLFDIPARYLLSCCYPGVAELFSFLKEKDIKIGIFSDYPAFKKLRALRLHPDIVVGATDADVNRLKPDPKGLYITAQKLDVPVGECLFIGDKIEKDGECARRLGMLFLLLDKKKNKYFSRCFFDYYQLKAIIENCIN